MKIWVNDITEVDLNNRIAEVKKMVSNFTPINMPKELEIKAAEAIILKAIKSLYNEDDVCSIEVEEYKKLHSYIVNLRMHSRERAEDCGYDTEEDILEAMDDGDTITLEDVMDQYSEVEEHAENIMGQYPFMIDECDDQYCNSSDWVITFASKITEHAGVVYGLLESNFGDFIIKVDNKRNLRLTYDSNTGTGSVYDGCYTQEVDAESIEDLINKVAKDDSLDVITAVYSRVPDQVYLEFGIEKEKDGVYNL